MPLTRVIEATALPVTVAEARTYARLDPDVPDPEIEGLILTASESWEGHTGQVLAESEWELTLDGFVADAIINLQTAPVLRVNSVTYVNKNGVEVEIEPTQYQLDNRSRPCVLAPAPDREWPTDCLDDINVVTINFTAGYETIERRQKQWVLAMVATLSRFRESHSESPAQPQPFIMGLLDPYRLPSV